MHENAMLAYNRRSFGRVLERIVRRVMTRIPASVAIMASIGGAWYLLRHERTENASLQPSACLHVVAAKRSGRLAWVIDETAKAVQVGDVLATMDNADDSAALRSPFGGALRTVLKKAGDHVALGDPVVIVGPFPGAVCP